MRIIRLNEELCDRYKDKLSGFIYRSMNRNCEKEWFTTQDAEKKIDELKYYLNMKQAFAFLATEEYPVGFLWAYPYGNIDSVYLSIIYVDDCYRGKSVGSCLINALEDTVKSEGYKRVWLHTDANNSISRSFYSVMGYEEERIQLSKDI